MKTIEAIFQGGPADRRIMVVPNLHSLDFLQVREGADLWHFDDDAPFATVPIDKYTYSPVAVRALYTVERVTSQ